MKCSKCSIVVAERDLVKCTRCSNIFHTICCPSLAGLSGDALKKRCCSLICSTCESTKPISKKSDTDLMSKIDIILKTVNDIKLSVAKHESLFVKVNKKLDELFNQVRDLGGRTDTLEKRVNSIENHVSNFPPGNTISEETIISEVFERQLRARNLIIINAPEPDDNNSIDDTNFLKSIFNSLSVDTAPLVVSRLGRKSNNIRPLKVILPESNDIFIVLKNKHKLRDSPVFNSIRICPDRTPMQRNQLRDAIAKLEERKTAGESNLTLKFLKGIPTITKN